MRVVFRTDASLDIGTGHVMRCLTLADALRARGARCRFICRAHLGNLLDLIRQRGHQAHALPLTEAPVAVGAARNELLAAQAAWLGTDWATDAQQTLAAFGAAPVDWQIVDHYALDARWESSLRTASRRLMVIDDLANRAHDCDLLLDQNLGRTVDDYAPLVPGACKILVGTHHALLRPEFEQLRPSSLARRQTPALKRILVALGGVDLPNVTGAILTQLARQPLQPQTKLTVVMGGHAPALRDVQRLALAMPWPTEVLVGIEDMAARMAESDFAVGAAGSSAWERCCLGVPSLCVVLADNQKVIATALEAAGAALVSQNGLFGRTEAELIARLQVNPAALLERMSCAAAALVDGQGASRVAACLVSAEIA